MVIDRYRLVEALARTERSAIWRVLDEQTGELLALKLLLSLTPECRERFLREAEIVESLRHPNIVRSVAHGVSHSGEPFMVTELLAGTDLRTTLRQRGRLGVQETLSCIDDVCGALDFAHRHGVLHRDIKPSNVFLCEPKAKLLDFGIAKVLDGPELTLSGETLGTPAYMSPEQVGSSKRVDHRTDLWACAVLAFVCLTGATPFQGKTAPLIWRAIDRNEYRPASQVNPALPPGVDSWFRRALHPAPECRIQTAAELSFTLHQALAR